MKYITDISNLADNKSFGCGCVSVPSSAITPGVSKQYENLDSKKVNDGYQGRTDDLSATTPFPTSSQDKNQQ